MDDAQLERLVALLTVGMAVAIQRDALTTEEAGNFLFSPHTMATLRARGARAELVDLVHSATEMEDVESLLPDQLHDQLDVLVAEALACLESGGPYDFSEERWLSEIVAVRGT